MPTSCPGAAATGTPHARTTSDHSPASHRVSRSIPAASRPPDTRASPQAIPHRIDRPATTATARRARRGRAVTPTCPSCQSPTQENCPSVAAPRWHGPQESCPDRPPPRPRPAESGPNSAPPPARLARCRGKAGSASVPDTYPPAADRCPRPPRHPAQAGPPPT